MVSTIGRMTGAEHVTSWREMRRRQQVAAEELLAQLESYLDTLALNLQQLFTQPFDSVHDNFGQHSLLVTSSFHIAPVYVASLLQFWVWTRSTRRT